MSICPHTFFYYLLILMALLIQPVRSQGILGMASGGMANNPIVSGELGGMQAGLSGAFFGFVVEKAAEAAGTDVTFQFQGTRAWFSLADLFRTTEQEQNLMKGILQLEVDTQSQTLTGLVITPDPSATMPGVIIYPSTPVPEYSPATSDIPLVDWSPILSRINSAILNQIKAVLQFGEWTDTAEVQCRTRYSASNTPIPEPTSTPDPAAALKEDERICEGFENDPFPESFGLYSTDEKNGDLTVEVHNAIGDVLAINPSSTTSSGYQTATLKYQPRQVPGGSSSAVSQQDVTQSSQACSESMETQSITETVAPEEPRPSKRAKVYLAQDDPQRICAEREWGEKNKSDSEKRMKENVRIYKEQLKLTNKERCKKIKESKVFHQKYRGWDLFKNEYKMRRKIVEKHGLEVKAKGINFIDTKNKVKIDSYAIMDEPEESFLPYPSPEAETEDDTSDIVENGGYPTYEQFEREAHRCSQEYLKDQLIRGMDINDEWPYFGTMPVLKKMYKHKPTVKEKPSVEASPQA